MRHKPIAPEQEDVDSQTVAHPESSSNGLARLSGLWRKSRRPEYRWLWLVAAALFYFLVVSLPLKGADEQSHKALAVFCVAVFLWGTNTLPMPITGIAILLLLPLTGALTPEKTFHDFGNKALFFVLGVFILASPIMRSGLSTRIALTLLSRFGRSQRTIVICILWLAAVMSCFISAHAVAAMLLPIVLEIVRATGAKPGSRFGLAAFLAMGWGAGIGSNTTLLGGARGALAIGILQSTTKQTISFADWILWAGPIVLLGMIAANILLLFVGQDSDISLKTAREFLENRTKEVGRLSKREIQISLIMIATIVLWVWKGDQLGLETISFIGVLLVFTFRVARWREVEEDVNWGIFIMYGSAIALSAAMRDTQASAILANHLFPDWITSSPIMTYGVLLAMTLVLNEFMSHAASVSMTMPIGIALAQAAGFDPRVVTLGIVIGAGMTFAFPTSTPAMALVVSSGYARLPKVVQWGICINVICFIILALMSKFYWPLAGLKW